MNYRLCVLTHGDNADVLSRTLAAFRANVTPLPTDAYIHSDGARGGSAAYHAARFYDEWPWTSGESSRQYGFCEATRICWAYGAEEAEHTHTFYLEHDFLVTRPVDLRGLATVLDAHPMLAQMALMRDAVNEQEKAAGGLFESRPGQYKLRHDNVARDVGEWVDDTRIETHTFAPWLNHSAYLTTNPSLMRRAFMAENPWPDHESECEGRFGIDLVQRGYSFGVWGSGEPWCRHIGERTGFGY